MGCKQIDADGRFLEQEGAEGAESNTLRSQRPPVQTGLSYLRQSA